MTVEPSVPRLEAPVKAHALVPAPRGRLTVFRKPVTPDPFVNAALVSLGKAPNGAERFWISCINVLEGSTSFLIDETGGIRAYPWPVGRGIIGVYAAAPQDDDTVWLAGASSTVLIRLSLESGKWQAFPRDAGRFVTSGIAFDADTTKLFVGAQTALLSFDTRACRTVRVYEGADKPLDNFQHDFWPNPDASHGTIMITPGLTYLRWDPRAERIDWQRLSDDPRHPAIDRVRKLGYRSDGRVYIPHFGWLDGATGNLTPHNHPPAREANWLGVYDRCVYGADSDPLTYATAILRWDPATGDTRTVLTVPDTAAMNCALSDSGKLITVTLYGELKIFDADTGLLRVSRLIGPEHTHRCNVILPIDETRLAGAPFISQNFWTYDTDAAEGAYRGRAAGRGGQVDCGLRVGRRVYFVAYTGGQLCEFDPHRTEGFPRNPRTVAQIEQGSHGTGITSDGDVVWAAFRPRYGALEGAMIRFDTRSGEARYRVGAVPHQHVLNPMFDPESGLLVGGTSYLSDCRTAEPVDATAYAVLLDPDTMDVVSRLQGPWTADAVQPCGPLGDGRWLFHAGGAYFAGDPSRGPIQPLTVPDAIAPDAPPAMATERPGRFAVRSGDRLLAWNPSEGAVEPLLEWDGDRVLRCWVHARDLTLDCGTHAAIWRDAF